MRQKSTSKGTYRALEGRQGGQIHEGPQFNNTGRLIQQQNGNVSPVEDGVPKLNNWLEQWQSSKLGTGGRVQSFLRAFPLSTDVPVLLLNQPTYFNTHFAVILTILFALCCCFKAKSLACWNFIFTRPHLLLCSRIVKKNSPQLTLSQQFATNFYLTTRELKLQYVPSLLGMRQSALCES